VGWGARHVVAPGRGSGVGPVWAERGGGGRADATRKAGPTAEADAAGKGVVQVTCAGEISGDGVPV